MIYLLWLTLFFGSAWLSWWAPLVLSFVVGAFSSSVKEALLHGAFGTTLSTLFIIAFAEFRHSMAVSTMLAKIFSLPSAEALILIVTILTAVSATVASGLGFWFRKSGSE